jgi:PTS system fructose-specific IIC component
MLDLKARRKSDIIMEMVGFFSSAGIVIDGQKFYERLLWRESLGSTGIGQGIATPYIYADLNVEEEIVTALAIIKEGVDFESLDGKPVQLIFMSAYKHHGKAENSSLHLKHLARISRFLRNEEHCQALLAANTKEEVFAYLKTNFS